MRNAHGAGGKGNGDGGGRRRADGARTAGGLERAGVSTVRAVVGDVESTRPPGRVIRCGHRLQGALLPARSGIRAKAPAQGSTPRGALGLTVVGRSDPRWRPVSSTLARHLPATRTDVDLNRPRHPDLADPPAITSTLHEGGSGDFAVYRKCTRSASHRWSSGIPEPGRSDRAPPGWPSPISADTRQGTPYSRKSKPYANPTNPLSRTSPFTT